MPYRHTMLWGDGICFCAGSFEEDVARVTAALALARPPRLICAVAAGVRDFEQAVSCPAGVYGIAQWFPGRRTVVELGPRKNLWAAASLSSLPR